MLTIRNVGADVKMGVTVFSTGADVVYEMTTITSGYVTELNEFIDGATACTSNCEPGAPNALLALCGYCGPCGVRGTNWALPLLLSKQHPWSATPDIYLWFTDGYPQYSGSNVPQTSCLNSCFSRTDSWWDSRICPSGETRQYCNGAGLDNLDTENSTPKGLWAACTAADLIKASTKLFMVAVGGVSGHENEIQTVTGRAVWDGEPSTFASADYFASTNYGKLAEILVKTVAGLCVCLQTAPACAGSSGPGICDAIQFTARIRISTGNAPAGTTYPRDAIVAGNVHYKYLPSPDTRMAIEFYSATQLVNNPTPSVVRTDLQNPCTLQRRVGCTAGCVILTETRLIPRFFHESTDITCPVAEQNKFGGCTCFEKVYTGYAQQPSSSSEMIKYVWVKTVGLTEPCAARGHDSTLYEFFEDSALNKGVNALGAFNFAPAGTCTATCQSNVELVFLIDEQTACSLEEYKQINSFAYGLIQTFPQNSFTKFAAAYSNTAAPSSAPPPSGGWTALTSASASTWKGILGCQSCSPIANPVHPKADGVNLNFATKVQDVAQYYWGSTSSGAAPRQLLTFLCGSSSSSDAEYTAMRSFLQARGVEFWSLGVGDGANNVQTLEKLASSNQYPHYLAVASSVVLADQLSTEAQLLCPQRSLCGPDCNGLCTCSAVGVTNCACPTCTETYCRPASCANGQTGCLSAGLRSCNDNNACTTDACDEVVQACDNKAINCADTNKCTADSCDTNLGCKNVAINCNDGNACTTDSCDTASGCKNVAINCDDGNKCTADSCDTNLGCKNVAINCNDGNACTTDSCDTASGCKNVAINCDDSKKCTADSCDTNLGCKNVATVCADTNVCTNDYCDAADGVCKFDSIPGCALCSLVGACSSLSPNKCEASGCIESGATVPDNAALAKCDAVTDYKTGYSASTCKTTVGTALTTYCFLRDLSSSKCPSSKCSPRTCNTGTGACDGTDLNCNDSNKCTTDSCNSVDGCVNSVINCAAQNTKCQTFACNTATGECVSTAVNCDDGDKCTTDSCNTVDGCVNAKSTCSSQNTKCQTFTCNTADGQCLSSAVNCDDGKKCTDDSCNTVDGCVNAASSCPSQTTKCQTFTCNVADGQCVSSAVNCDDGKQCTLDSCDLVTGCLNVPISCSDLSTCFSTACDPADGVCRITSTAKPCAPNNVCEEVVCREGPGCVRTNRTCDPRNECEFPTGCVERNGAAVCEYQNISGTYDLCGVCLGDNAVCFTSSIFPTSASAGIAAGAVAAIVIAAIIVGLLVFFLTRKGYQYYMAKSNMASTGLQHNPVFQDNAADGSMPDHDH